MDTSSDEFYESIDLHIRWSDRQDLVLRVSPEETIYTIKEKVQLSLLKHQTQLYIDSPFLE